MAKILSLVNTVSSTSIPVEIADAVNKYTDFQVVIGSLQQGSEINLDPDIESMDLDVQYFGGDSNFDPRPYKRLYEHIGSNGYDVVHTHHNFSGSISRLIARNRGLNIINTEHNDYRHFTAAQQAVKAVTFGLSDVNIYNSYSTRSSLGPLARHLSSRNEVIYNGVNLNRIRAGKGYSLPVDLPDGTLVTNVGVMTEQKNQRSLLEAAYWIKNNSSLDDLYFIIAGSGPLLDELQNMAVRLQIDDIVFFTGYLPKREHIYKLLHESDIFTSPSIFEGFCVAAVEAMAIGLPVVVSDIDVLHEVVGKPGVFVNPNDTSAFANAIADLVANPEKRSTMGAKAKDRARTNFSLKKTAREYYKIYTELCDSTHQ